MKLIHGVHRWNLLIVILLVLGSVTMGHLPAFAQTGSASSSVIPSNITAVIGEQISVEIGIDVSAVASPDHALGGFSGSLAWDPAVLAYDGNSGVLAGFIGVVNVLPGQVIFNGINTGGTDGNVIVFRLTFDVIGPGSSILDLDYRTMAAASTFQSLLPLLTINDGYVQVQSNLYTIAASAGAHGSIDPDGDVIVTEGNDQSFSITPDAGYAIADVLVDSSSVGAVTSYTFSAVQADHSIEATFEEIPSGEYSLTVNVVGGGSVTPQGGTYAADTVVQLTATPNTGWIFSGWSDDLTGNTNPADLTMDGDKTVTATFEKEETGDLTIEKKQSLDGTAWTFDTLDVSLGESFFYQLTVTNTFDVAMDFSISDTLDGLVGYGNDGSWLGTITGNLLEYSGQVLANSEVILAFMVTVTDIFNPADTVIENSVELQYGNSSKMSNIVKAEIKNPVEGQVPEPSTVLFVGTGLLGMYALARKRRRSKR